MVQSPVAADLPKEQEHGNQEEGKPISEMNGSLFSEEGGWCSAILFVLFSCCS